MAAALLCGSAWSLLGAATAAPPAPHTYTNPIGDTSIHMGDPFAFWHDGATVLKHRGRYYMTYSANHTGFPHYGVGYATANRPLGPWTKADENPILATHLEIGVSAPGHNSLVPSPDRTELFIVYHTHANPQKPSDDRVVNIDRMEFTPEGKLRVKGPTRSPQPLPSGAQPMAAASVAPSAFGLTNPIPFNEDGSVKPFRP